MHAIYVSMPSFLKVSVKGSVLGTLLVQFSVFISWIHYAIEKCADTIHRTEYLTDTLAFKCECLWMETFVINGPEKMQEAMMWKEVTCESFLAS